MSGGTGVSGRWKPSPPWRVQQDLLALANARIKQLEAEVASLKAQLEDALEAKP